MSGSSNNLVDPNHLQSEPPGGLVGGGGGAASLRGSHSNLTPNAFTALNKIAHVSEIFCSIKIFVLLNYTCSMVNQFTENC